MGFVSELGTDYNRDRKVIPAIKKVLKNLLFLWNE